MHSTKETLHQIADPTLSDNQRAQLRCELAGQLEEAGNYETARDAMGKLWRRVGERPVLEGLDQETRARVLVRVGTLTRDIGSAGQIEGATETAKNLLSEGILLFQTLQMMEQVAEAQIEMAVCYGREGALDEARIMLEEALSQLGDAQTDLRATGLLRSAIVEWSAKRFHDALRILTEAAPLFAASNNEVLKGKLHNGLGFVLKNLGGAEARGDYIDRALIEYAAASFYFEKAGLTRYAGCVQNNLGFLFGIIGKFANAHEHLDRAQALFTTLKDNVNLAQADDTRARIMLAEGRTVEAEKISRTAVRTLEKGDELSLLAAALTTQGIALARLHHEEQARKALDRAIKVAEQAGDLESAGLAALVMIEELSSHLSNDNLHATVERAGELLRNTQDMSTLRRLVACASQTTSLLHDHPDFPPRIDWTKFSFYDAVLRYEAHLIKLALKDSDGRPTRAAHLLGFKHHQSLLAMLNGRHQALRKLARPVVPRKRSMICQPEPNRPTDANKEEKTIRILHVEDNQVVAEMVRETLEVEGWAVEVCSDGTTALEKIAGNNHYDLLLLDFEVPGTNGRELVQRARELTRDAQTPIVVLSAAPVGAAVCRAGANAFLHKPQDMNSVVATIKHWLNCQQDATR